MSGSPRLFQFGRVALTLAAGLCLLPLGGCSLKWAFVELSYADPPPELPTNPDVGDLDPGPDLAYAAYTVLLPMLLADYEQPAAVGVCLDAIADDEDRFDALIRYGNARIVAKPRDWYATDELLHKANRVWAPWPEPCAATGLETADQVRLATALAASAAAAVNYGSRSVSGSIASADVYKDPNWKAVQRGYLDALVTAARLLRHDPSVPEPIGDALPPAGARTTRRQLPSLVLSGGAGNGAFAAGYIYELLYLRQRALELSPRASAFHRSIERDARFGSISATSVGSLIAVAVDLYYADQPEAGLERLEHGFIVDEWDLFKVCRGNALSLVGVNDGSLLASPQVGLLRFDPLMDGVLGTTLREHGEAMLANDVIRVTTAVEARLGLLALLDERACRALDGDARLDCLETAIKASISEPALAAPVPRVYSGLRDTGEPGTWLDGGLRSGSPATIGSAYNGEWGRVLAVNTHRYRGVPREGFENAAQLLLRTITTFTEQTRAWELAFAELDDEARHAARCRMESHLELPNERDRLCVVLPAEPEVTEPCEPEADALGCPSPAGKPPRHFGAIPDAGMTNSWLRTIYVPEHIPTDLVAQGYAFDRELLEGLWLAGRKHLLGDVDETLSWLGDGWDRMMACADNDPCPDVFAAEVEDQKKTVDEAWESWLQDWAAIPAEQRIRDHRRELRRNLESCWCEQDTCRD